MSKKKKKLSNKKSAPPQAGHAPIETRASESLTVFWAVTVLMVLVMNLVCIGAHYYIAAHPEAEKMQLLKGLLLFTGSVIGGLSLLVLGILYRVRRIPPPPGLAVFGACVAAAPILTVLVQSAR